MKYYILLVDDEPEILEVAARDLQALEDVFPIETASRAAEARDLIDELQRRGDRVGVIFCDHVMPGGNGVDLLIELEENDSTRDIRKVLLTGQAGLDATIRAVNESRLDHYVAKPWKEGELEQIARTQMTEYFINTGEDFTPFLSSLDSLRLNEGIHRKNLMGDA